MRSKAAIGDHPIHPALVPVPIGAFVLALIGDIAHASTGDAFWYRFAFVAIGVGIVTALLAAIFGAIDYFGVPMGAPAARLATRHLILNLVAVALYAVSFFLRRHGGALNTPQWTPAMGLAIAGILVLGVSGWIGGKLAYEHHVGVVESSEKQPAGAVRRTA
jgi:uncharacterized membrane protein